jgi:uncharacterized membrane protein YcaP (DUF421 family)
MTTFDFVLLLFIAEATQQALLSNDNSLINAMLLVGTLVTIDVLFSVFSYKWDFFDKIANGVPVVILEDGKPIKERMRRARVEVGDIMEAARRFQGLERLDQIKYAVLEKDGKISIIPQHATKVEGETAPGL